MPSNPHPAPRNTGLVLSGGGARGAYEVGVVAGIVEVMGKRDRCLFQVFSGSSVGAINSAFLAANAHRPHLGISELIAHWESLDLHAHLNPRLRGLWSQNRLPTSLHYGPSVLDVAPLERLVQTSIDFETLHGNVSSGTIDGLLVSALEIANGRTTIFTELSPSGRFRPSQDPRRRALAAQITAQHVLASSALPLLLPARRIDSTYYSDGGLRFNTPIAPAIRAGSDRLVVISVAHSVVTSGGDKTLEFPSVAFLLGKILNALLLDPIGYDLQVLGRLNKFWEVLQESAPPEVLERVEHVLAETRGASYRKLDTLTFFPSQDIGEIAGAFVRDRLADKKVRKTARWVLNRISGVGLRKEADFASYLLFDGDFAHSLIQLGFQDALDRETEVRSFFSD